ncbi:FAD-binding domain-containing protein [Marasmius fiardii PR-910]|nr:FAD-binding domain-containing protein [Marasmius fiardii PR-910]
MFPLTFPVLAILLYVSFLIASIFKHAHPPITATSNDICAQIKNTTSAASDVYYPGQDLRGDPTYAKDIEHWVGSSSQNSLCSVQPGTAEDVGVIIKGGGHSLNPGFSSTTGVQISMTRFSEVTYNAQSQTVVIGAGNKWDNVYATLAPHNMSVLGGRVSGVGVAGFTLGGGYSWLSNQYGLTVDSVTAFELVKPEGKVITVTEYSDSDLFFALKGGLITYTASHVNSVTAATAYIITTYNFLLGSIGVSQLLFYDGPTAPNGIFDDFLNITFFTKDVKTRNLLDLVQAAPADLTSGQRGLFQTVPLLKLTPTILEAAVNETMFWGSRLSGTFISYQAEPFVPGVLSHASSASAYPSSRSTTYLPFNIYYAWMLPRSDPEFHDAIQTSARQLTDVTLAEGQTGLDTANPYPNYAIYDMPITRLYGENLGRLQAIKVRVDPGNVMGLADCTDNNCIMELKV